MKGHLPIFWNYRLFSTRIILSSKNVGVFEKNGLLCKNSLENFQKFLDVTMFLKVVFLKLRLTT